MPLRMRNPFDSGGNGGIVISDTSAHTGNFYAFQVVTAATLNTNGTVGNLTNANGVSFPVGMIVYGVFTSLQLVSGSVIAYST